MAADDDK
jgi:hypothetical protein